MAGLPTIREFALPSPAVPLPDTPAGRQADAWLGTINSGDPAAMRDFAASRLATEELARATAEQQAARRLLLHFMTRGFRPVLFDGAEDHRLIVFLQAALTGEWLRAELTVEADPPHRITRGRAWRSNGIWSAST